MDQWINGWINGSVDRLMDQSMDGWMDGGMDLGTFVSELISVMRCRGGVFLFVCVCWRGRVGGNWCLVIWGSYRKRLSPAPPTGVAAR